MQALAAAIVAFTMLYLKRLYTIDATAVYRKALIALNTNPGVLEVNAMLLCRHDVYNNDFYGMLCFTFLILHSSYMLFALLHVHAVVFSDGSAYMDIVDPFWMCENTQGLVL